MNQKIINHTISNHHSPYKAGQTPSHKPKLSQRQAIYNHLMTGASIHPLSALDRFGCLSLAQRISELRLDYHIPVLSKLVHTPQGKKYATYWLDKDYIADVKAGKIKRHGA